ncbi:YdcF family protein [Thermostichus vulcanus]|uniref:YdcF family protein n=1 Tax=Thermostichus vulcanus str. 'Rupite' TaxID=2813851 RepID=A0ABT0CDZ8_THEVL|nr:YdcF family protein [Thermostichus vulcanus]MCJ2544013.1 YdcF family protein [Thermostichus vulcanus str. 'Rupite']
MLRHLQLPARYRRPLICGLLGLTLACLSFPFIRLGLAASQSPTPQGILMLGGGAGREAFTAEFAQDHPDLPIWVSTGAPPAVARPIFAARNIGPPRLILDYRAVDTLTNFTSLVNDFQAQDIRHLYLITSADHMPRARLIASIVLGSRGIAFTPVPIPPNTLRDPGSRESLLHIARDGARAYGWLLTGRSGATITLWVHPERRRGIDEGAVQVRG